MSIPSVTRFLSFFALFLFSIQGALLGSQAFAQKLTNFDASVNVFGQFSGSTSGNGVSDTPTRSMGGLGTFRQSFKPWLGYEVNYSYTRFAEVYSGLPFPVQDNLHEATGAYLAQGPKLLGFQPFATAGGGWLIFLPTAVGGQQYHQQSRPVFLYEIGVNYPILTQHFGARVEYRGLLYSTPNFGEEALNTGAMRQTSEPTVGLYVHF